jgi:hypothetical protein
MSEQPQDLKPRTKTFALRVIKMYSKLPKSDTDGSVSRVDFYANGSLIGTDTAAPFSFTWSNVSAGSYSITAIATDNDGASTTSGPVSITVN